MQRKVFLRIRQIELRISDCKIQNTVQKGQDVTHNKYNKHLYCEFTP